MPHKNILPINGKPLIAYSIEQALYSKHITKTVVSTDDPDISCIAKQYGVDVVDRPKEISNDYATSESAILHVLQELDNDAFRVDLIVFLQCTSPMREPDDIDNAIEKFYEEKADSLLSGCKNERFFWRRTSDNMAPINYDYKHRMRDQDHPEEYAENGSIYICKPDLLKKFNNRLCGKIAMYEMNYWSFFQIDSTEDFQLISWLMSRER